MQQKSLIMNANPHPRDCHALNILFNSVKLDENKNAKRLSKSEELAQFKMDTCWIVSNIRAQM